MDSRRLAADLSPVYFAFRVLAVPGSLKKDFLGQWLLAERGVSRLQETVTGEDVELAFRTYSCCDEMHLPCGAACDCIH